jgi:hypothetical protein
MHHHNTPSQPAVLSIPQWIELQSIGEELRELADLLGRADAVGSFCVRAAASRIATLLDEIASRQQGGAV